MGESPERPWSSGNSLYAVYAAAKRSRGTNDAHAGKFRACYPEWRRPIVVVLLLPLFCAGVESGAEEEIRSNSRNP